MSSDDWSGLFLHDSEFPSCAALAASQLGFVVFLFSSASSAFQLLPDSFAAQACVLFLWMDELSSSVLISISSCLVRDGASHDLSYFKFH